MKIDIQDWVASGFFFSSSAKSSKGFHLTCYDCGLVIRDVTGKTRSDEPRHDADVIHAAALLRYKVLYMKDSFPSGMNPDIVQQAYSRLIRVKPECDSLNTKNINFSLYQVRLKSHCYRTSYSKNCSPSELAAAGFVGTSSMTLACYSCYATLDWSDVRLHIYSPWALHAWSKESSNCKFLNEQLANYGARLKTYPSVWFKDRELPTPERLSAAGFYCGFWERTRRSWVKCYTCTAYIFQWPGVKLRQKVDDTKYKFAGSGDRRGTRGEEIHDNQKNEADSTQHEAGGHGEVGEHNEVGNHDETAPPVTTDENKWLALLAAETKGEIPGKAYGYLDENNGGQRDIPIVSHYIQKIDCGFVQEVLSDPKVRLQTFPPDWAALNHLTVTTEEVAQAGFVHYPLTSKVDTWAKLMPHSAQHPHCTLTICPKCLLKVDWSIERRPPSSLLHCQAKRNLLDAIRRLVDHEVDDTEENQDSVPMLPTQVRSGAKQRESSSEASDDKSCL